MAKLGLLAGSYPQRDIKWTLIFEKELAGNMIIQVICIGPTKTIPFK